MRSSFADNAVSSWKCVANNARHLLTSCRCSTQPQAIERPSKVAVPRPISSRMTNERSLAWFKIVAVSTISTIKVDRPRAKSSAAPTRLNNRSSVPIWALAAGTNEPICAKRAIKAFCRRKVDLPAMLGPVRSKIDFSLSSSLPDKLQLLEIKLLSPDAFKAASTTGCRPPSISKANEVSMMGLV